MPRDQRLYMTFPNDVHRHPKLMRLSVEARWAFIEMNGEARLSDNDGVFTNEEALFHWPVAVLDELCGSHPTRPLVTRDDDGSYRVRDYAEHQQTRVEREALAEKRANAGRLGGKARASAKQVLSNLEQSQAEIEREKEIEISSSPAIPEIGGGEAKLKETRLPKDWTPTTTHFELAKGMRVDLQQQVEAFRLHAETHDRHAARWNAAFTTWLKKSKPGVRTPVAVTPQNEWMFR